MKIKTTIRAGRITQNHNAVKAVKVKTKVRAGTLTLNHNAVRV